MKKVKSASILLLGIIFVMFFLGSGIDFASQEKTAQLTENTTQPMILSPEKTMEVFLTAFVERNLETIEAYLPGGISEEGKAFRKRSCAYYSQFMNDRKHIKRIIEIKLVETKNENNGILAFIETTFETSPSFSGKADLDKDGTYKATYKWAFRQYKPGKPWLFDGGGL